MHADDNVAIVANDGGLPAGTLLPAGVPGAGITLRDKTGVRPLSAHGYEHFA